MSTTVYTIPFANICYDCAFYKQRSADEWHIGECTNPVTRVRTKKPRYATDKKCVQKVTYREVQREEE